MHLSSQTRNNISRAIIDIGRGLPLHQHDYWVGMCSSRIWRLKRNRVLAVRPSARRQHAPPLQVQRVQWPLLFRIRCMHAEGPNYYEPAGSGRCRVIIYCRCMQRDSPTGAVKRYLVYRGIDHVTSIIIPDRSPTIIGHPVYH